MASNLKNCRRGDKYAEGFRARRFSCHVVVCSFLFSTLPDLLLLHLSLRGVHSDVTVSADMFLLFLLRGEGSVKMEQLDTLMCVDGNMGTVTPCPSSRRTIFFPLYTSFVFGMKCETKLDQVCFAVGFETERSAQTIESGTSVSPVLSLVSRREAISLYLKV